MRDVKHFESLYPVDSREDELRELVEFIKKGNSVQIVGLPGNGRSTILGLLAYNSAVREKHFPKKNAFVHFVMLNFSELADRPLMDVTKLMFLNLADSLRERGMEGEYRRVNDIFRESLSMSDEFVLFQGLKRAIEYLSIEKKLTIIFLMDRLEEYIPMLNHAFFSNLRILRNIAKYRFSFIFTLYKPIEDILEPSVMADVHDILAGHIVYSRLYDRVSLDFRIGYIEQLTEKKLGEVRKKEIFDLTGGHWKLTRLSVEAALTSDSADVTETNLLERKTIRGALDEILSALSPNELRILTVLSNSGGRDSVSTDEDILRYFEKVGLLNDGTITIPLLSAYLRFGKSDDMSEPIIYDKKRRVIRKGETVLSESLTASEFRLLSYMLQHPQRVIERNEVIDVVWKDTKSTEGVTDQAVDQLIFRIRRKIETDPNNPRHLITVKGRGFEFRP